MGLIHNLTCEVCDNGGEECLRPPIWTHTSPFMSCSWTQVLHLRTPMTTRCTPRRCTHHLTPRLSPGRPTAPPLLLTRAALASESPVAQIIHQPAQRKLSWPGSPRPSKSSAVTNRVKDRLRGSQKSPYFSREGWPSAILFSRPDFPATSLQGCKCHCVSAVWTQWWGNK